jgi:hypothetical protein
VGAPEFARQLRDLGHQVTELPDSNVRFPWKIPMGRLMGQVITLGFTVPADFPVTPPGGPCLTPALHHPAGAVHAAPAFGPDWVYWSRPFPGWAGTDRTVRTYLAHIRRLFGQL